MKRNTYRNRSIVFGCIAAPFVIGFVSAAVNTGLTLKAIPGTAVTLALLFFFVFYAVKHDRYIKKNYADELRAEKEARKLKRKIMWYKMKFRRTRKMGFIWLDDKHKMFQTRFTFVPLVYLYSEFVDYKVDKKTSKCAYTRFHNDKWGNRTATTTFGTGINYFNLVIILTNGRRKIYHMLYDYYHKKNFDKMLVKTKEALECICENNRGTAEPEYANAHIVFEFDVF